MPGPAEILVILIVALLVFGPQRLPEVGRQIGAAMRELRRMQDTVRGELDMVLHPEHGTATADASLEPADHTYIPPEAVTDRDAGPPADAGEAEPGDPDAVDAERRFRGPPDSFI